MRILIRLLLLVVVALAGVTAEEGVIPVGVAQLDITPDYPVRLSGFGGRRAESEGITQRIWAKALAFGDEKNGPAVLITADNLCVPDEITGEIAKRLAEKVGLRRERLTITATHTHTAPMLKNVCPTLFGVPIPPEHQKNIDRYTVEFADALEMVALEAVKTIRPAKVSWGIGSADFALNRRTKGGPVDHDLPLLMVFEPDGKPRAIYFSYACHCVTLSNNKISGDWAGFAQARIQELFPGAIALGSVGCGADSNPSSGVTGDNVAVCAQQGDIIAQEVKRVVQASLTPVRCRPETRYTRVDLPLAPARSHEEWERRAKQQDAVGHHARVNLAKLDRGEKLPEKINYPIQTWIFGDDLAIVFLPGETVVDYSLQLKRQFDRRRLWINGYSNDGRCYIPSERVLREGGYEGGDAMIYYDFPQKFAPGLEQIIIDAVNAQIPQSFKAPPGTEGTRPLSSAEALRSFRTKPGFKVELVAAEPLIQSPVAIDWGADGKLWVCEMNDYPSGMDQNWKPGGRVKVLIDENGDGKYDRAEPFVENLPFPTGVTAWGRGVLICAAPDILYAEDTSGDGKADKVEKLYTGFFTDNYQARVNSLNIGLDNWIYGANGLLGGEIQPLKNSLFPAAREAVNIRNRDFRFHPFRGTFETVSGLSQQGRVRDDFGNWFGCDNSRLLLHFPIFETYIRRNPHVAAPPSTRDLTARRDGNRLFPSSPLLERFNDPDNANRVTSACGLGIYRDTLLGEEFYGNAFTCEPVHNLVHREVIKRNPIFASERASHEKDSEFLSSTDNWFRPVQARPGPDGALYIVDMYRFLIEHPRWIPAARLAQIEVRAGSDRGRIYRVVPADKPLRRIHDLTKLKGADLVAALETPNGIDRDRVQIELLLRQDKSTARALKQLAAAASLPQVRVQALATLEGLSAIDLEPVQKALKDSDPAVREHAIRLAEPFLKKNGAQAVAFLKAVLPLTNESSATVVRQLAFTLGETTLPDAGRALAGFARAWLTNAEIRTAVITSAAQHRGEILSAVMSIDEKAPGRAEWIAPLVATAANSQSVELVLRAIRATLPANREALDETQMNALATLLENTERSETPVEKLLDRPTHERVRRAIANAGSIALDTQAPEKARIAAVALVGRNPSDESLAILARLATEPSEAIRRAAIAALQRWKSPKVASEFLARWREAAPTARGELIALLLNRDEWILALLEAVRQGLVQPHEFSRADRQRLVSSDRPQIRKLATELLPVETVTGRAEVIERYKETLRLAGNAARGAEVFTKNCASCHALHGIGHAVGPDLLALRSRDAEYWIKNILDPNAVIEPRFVNYQVELKDDRSLNGVIQNENATSLTILPGNGLAETILRSDISNIRASTLSLMPEGLEEGIDPQQMADLIAFVRSGNARPHDEVLRDPASLARFILDSSQPEAARSSAINANPQYAAALIKEMTGDLVPGTPEEYTRIPWIWRVAIACGKRNDAGQIKAVIDASVPQQNEPLRDWHAVVFGGGIVNGISQRGLWPAERIDEILAQDAELKQKWLRSLDLAAKMADDEKVPTGTRYDALRMIALQGWQKRGAQLLRYLAKDAHPELQMGAVSGLVDIDAPEAAAALIQALSYLTGENRKLALDGLNRDDHRKALLAKSQSARAR